MKIRKGFRARWMAKSVPNTPKLPNDPTEAGNILLTLCNLEGFLLFRLIDSLRKKHQEEGGFTENLYRRRVEFRKNNQKEWWKNQ